MQIEFRPHHFLCTFCFKGKGYSPEFVDNYQVIAAQLKQDADTPIRVVNHTDSICSPCPHRQGLRCTTEAKVQHLDQAHAGALEIQPGDVLTWREAKNRIAERIDLNTFHKICATCSWKASGICESVLS